MRRHNGILGCEWTLAVRRRAFLGPVGQTSEAIDFLAAPRQDGIVCLLTLLQTAREKLFVGGVAFAEE
jgi:hypothetical protein